MSVQLKLKQLTSEEIAAMTGGRLVRVGNGAGRSIGVVSTDSRKCTEGSLFCAIAGERYDAHDFAPEACKSGACAMLVNESRAGDTAAKLSEMKLDCDLIVTENSVTALGALAHEYKKFTSVKTIAVTGSVGKTTTKEFIYAIASEAFKTHKTEGNYNNEIGLPLTLLSLAPDDRVSVIEMGMSGFGEIEHMSRIAEPDIALITNIGTSHMEMLGSRENICRAKTEIIAGMKHGGTFILNADEPLLYRYADEPLPDYGNPPPTVKFVSVFNRAGDYRAVNVRHTGSGIIYDLIYDQKAVTNIAVPALGQHNVCNSLIAYTVGIQLGMSDEQIRRGLKNFKSVEMRQSIYDIGDITVIDDCYNASPESMRAGIDVLVSMAAGKHVRAAALLGDMKELGENSRFLHDQIGQYAAQKKVELLFCYGLRADVLAEAAIKKGIRAENVYVSLDTSDPQAMADMIVGALQPGDILLVKASRAVAAEKVIECIKKKKKKK